MSAPKHTPGPWAVHPLRAVVVPIDHLARPLGAHEDATIDKATYAQEICQMHWPDRNREEAEVEANARLVAAAPELLAALIHLTMHCGDYSHMTLAGIAHEATLHPGDRIEAEIAARAAIAKAKGKA